MRYSERVTQVVSFDPGSCSILMSAHYASATFGKLRNADPSGHCPRSAWRKSSAEPCKSGTIIARAIAEGRFPER